MNTTNITEYIMLGIKKFLAYLGIPMHLLDKVEPFLYIIVIAAIAFLLAEIVYRIVLLLSKRILKHKEYTFIAKLLEYNALRKQAYILPPIIMNTLLPLAFGHNPTLLHYMENAVWIYFVVAVTMAVTAIIIAMLIAGIHLNMNYPEYYSLSVVLLTISAPGLIFTSLIWIFYWGLTHESAEQKLEKINCFYLTKCC